MQNNYLLDIDIDSEKFEEELEIGILANQFGLLIRWTSNTKITILDVAIKKGTVIRDLLTGPIVSQSGSVMIPLGPHEKPNFKVAFRVYAFQEVPKMKAFLVDDTLHQIVRRNPAPANKFKSLKKKQLWSSTV